MRHSQECLRECWRLQKTLDALEIVNNSFSVLSVSFDSLALRANSRLLYLKDPDFSIVVNSAEFGFSSLSPLRSDSI